MLLGRLGAYLGGRVAHPVPAGMLFGVAIFMRMRIIT